MVCSACGHPIGDEEGAFVLEMVVRRNRTTFDRTSISAMHVPCALEAMLRGETSDFFSAVEQLEGVRAAPADLRVVE